MKYFVSLAVAALLLGCGGNDEKSQTTSTTHNIAQVAKEATTNAVEKTKQVAHEATQQAVEKTKQVAQATQEKVEKAATTVKETTQQAVEKAEKKVAAVTQAVDAKQLYSKCAGCHGADGKTKALGKSEPIAGWSKPKTIDALNGYKAGTRNIHGMGAVMKGQASSLDEKQIEALGEYISKLH